MSEFELVLLLREFGGSISEQFNFWLATTFAIVIASYTAGDRLNRYIRLLLVVLYLMACWVFYLRYIGALDDVSTIAERLRALDSEFAPRLMPWASFGRKFVMIAGTLLAVVIVARPSLAAGSEDSTSHD